MTAAAPQAKGSSRSAGEQAHTPTPWYVAPRTARRPKNGYRWAICEAETIKCVAFIDTLDADEREANADFIVRACNSRDALVAALRTMTDAFEMAVTIREQRDNKVFHLDRAEIVKARAALAAASAA